MAGSYRHVVDHNNAFRGVELIDNLGDAYEALEEMYDMIQFLAKTFPFPVKETIHTAWRYGHPRPPENTADESLCGYEAFWENEGGA